MQNSDKNKRTKTNFEIDHIVPAGSLNSEDDIKGWIIRLLFVTLKDLRILCKDCHRVVSYAEKEGLSFDKAKVVKEAISIVSSKKDKEWLSKKGILPASTQVARRKQIIDYLESNND